MNIIDSYGFKPLLCSFVLMCKQLISSPQDDTATTTLYSWDGVFVMIGSVWLALNVVWSDGQKMAQFWSHETIEASSSWMQSLPHALWHNAAEMPCDISEQWLSLHHPPIKL